MARICFVLAVLATLAAATSTETTPGYISVHVLSPNQFHPAAESNEKFIRTYNQSRAAAPLDFSLGQRKPGDVLLATQSGEKSNTPPHDIHLVFSYPTFDKGQTVHYMQILLNRNASNVHVTSGGIGQKQMRVQLITEGNNASVVQVNYTINIYGGGSRIIVNQVLFIGLVASLFFKYW